MLQKFGQRGWDELDSSQTDWTEEALLSLQMYKGEEVAIGSRSVVADK
jgi:hypothetical protein